MTDRAVSTTLEYVLAFAMAATLVTGLLFVGSEHVRENRERVTENQLRVIGQHVAADISRVDRLARAGSGASHLELTVDYPNRVTGEGYSITVDAGPTLELSSFRTDTTVTVEFVSETDVRATTVTGGDLLVEYDPAADEVVVSADG